MEKHKNMIIRIPEVKLFRYKELCEKNGYTMSKRIRNFIDEEIIELENNIKFKK